MKLVFATKHTSLRSDTTQNDRVKMRIICMSERSYNVITIQNITEHSTIKTFLFETSFENKQKYKISNKQHYHLNIKINHP